MSNKQAAEPATLLIDLDDRSNVNLLAEKIKELKSSGYNNVNLEIRTTNEQKKQFLLLDINLFSRIKEVQDLPDWVIIKLILSAGKLHQSGIQELISNA